MTLLNCGEALCVPMWLINALKSGEASLFADGTKTLQLKVEDKRIDVNLMNKELLKDILKSAEEKEESPIEKLTMLKNLAEELKKDGFTITISYKGSILLTLGSEADPTLSQAVTRTNAIEINNLKDLIRIII